jgi:hypothetical protein
MSPWQRLLEQPHSGGHFVQVYAAGDAAFVKNVGHYLWEGLRQGEGVLVVATAEHWRFFSLHLAALGADVERFVAGGQLSFLDAHQALTRFMIGGQPVWLEFERLVQGALRELRRQHRSERTRAYGEMVGILWKLRRYAAAVRLEQFWNRLLEQSSLSLYCAYAIDIFSPEFAGSNLDGVLRAHTHLIPAEPDGKLEAALYRSMDEVLGAEADELRDQIRRNVNASWAVLPSAENAVLWLRKNRPAQAEDILARARQHYGNLSAVKPWVASAVEERSGLQ